MTTFSEYLTNKGRSEENNFENNYQNYLNNTTGKMNFSDYLNARNYGYPSLTEQELSNSVSMTGRELLEEQESPGFMGALWSGLKAGATLGWAEDEPVARESMTFGEEAAELVGHLAGGLVPFTIASAITGGASAPIAGARWGPKVYQAFRRLGRYDKMTKNLSKSVDDITKQARTMGTPLDELLEKRSSLKKAIEVAKSKATEKNDNFLEIQQAIKNLRSWDRGLSGSMVKDYSKLKSKFDLTMQRRLVAESTIKEAQKEYIEGLVSKGAHTQARRLSKMVAKTGTGYAPPMSYGKILGNSKTYRDKIIRPLAERYGYKGAAIADRFANSAITFASVGLVSNKPGYSLADRAADLPKDAFMGMMFAAAGTPTLLGKKWGPKLEPVALMALGGYPDYLMGKPDPNMDMRDRLLHGLGLVAFHYVGHGLSNVGVKDKMFKGLIEMGFDEPIAFEMAYKTKFTDDSISHSRKWYQRKGTLYHSKKNPKDVIALSEFKSKSGAKGAEEEGFIRYIHLDTEETGTFTGKNLKEARNKLNSKYKKVDFNNEKLIDDLPPSVRENADAFMEGFGSDWVEIGGEKKWKLSGGRPEPLGRDIPKYEPGVQEEVNFYKSQRKDLEKVSTSNRVFDPIRDVEAKVVEKAPFIKGDLIEWVKDGKEMNVDSGGNFYPVRVLKADKDFVYLNIENLPAEIIKNMQTAEGGRIPISEAKMVRRVGRERTKGEYKLNLRYSSREDGKNYRTLKESSWDDPNALIFDSREAAIEYANKHWIGKFESNPTIESKIKLLNAKENKIKKTKEYRDFGREKGMMDKSFEKKEFTESEKQDVLRIMFPSSQGDPWKMTSRQIRRVNDLIRGDDSISFDVFDSRIPLPPENFVGKITSNKYAKMLKMAGTKIKETILGTGAIGEALGGYGAEQSFRQKQASRFRNTFMGLTVNLHNSLKRDLKGTGVTLRQVNDHIQAYLDETFAGMRNSKESKAFAEKLQKIKIQDSEGREVNGLDAVISRYRKYYDEAAIAQISSNSYIRDTSTRTLKRVPFVEVYDIQGNKIKLVDINKDFELHNTQINCILKWMRGEAIISKQAFKGKPVVINEFGERVAIDTKKSKHHYIKDYSRKQVTQEFFDFINGPGDALDKAAAYMARNDKELKLLGFDEGFARAKQLIKDIQKVHSKKNIYGQQYTRIADLPAYIYISRGKGGFGDIIPMDKNMAFKENGKPYQVGETMIVGDNQYKIGKRIKVYDTDYVNVIDNYSSGLAHSTSSYYAWGDGKGRINATIDRISDGLARQTEDPYYKDWSKKIMESQIYGEKQSIFSKVMNPISRWSAISGLSSPLSGLKNLFLGNVQNATVFTGRELWQSYLSRDYGLLNPRGEFFRKWSSAKEYAEQTGATYQSSFDLHLTTSPLSGFMKRWLPNLGLMRTTEILNRTVAQSIGPFSAEIHIANMAMKKNPATKGVSINDSRRILRDVLEFTPEQVNSMIQRYRTERQAHIKHYNDNGKAYKFRLNEIERRQASQQAHIITQGSGDLPYIPYWMGKGWAKPLTLFYRVAYRITDTVAKNVVKPVVVDGNMVPAMKYIALSTLSGKALYAAYDFVFDEERVNKFKDTPSQWFDYFIKAEGLALFSNASNEYGGWEEAYYPVPLRNVETVWDNLWDFVQGKKFGSTAFGDGMKEIVALYGATERAIKNRTEKDIKRYDDSKRRQYKFLDTYYPKDQINLDYEDGINAKTPHYRALRDVFWHDDPAIIAKTYYTSLAFLTHRIMSEKGITNYLLAEKDARERLKRTISSLQPLPKSWMKTMGRTGKSRYMEYFDSLSPEDRDEENSIMNTYREKQLNFYQAIAKYRNIYYKKG